MKKLNCPGISISTQTIWLKLSSAGEEGHQSVCDNWHCCSRRSESGSLSLAVRRVDYDYSMLAFPNHGFPDWSFSSSSLPWLISFHFKFLLTTSLNLRHGSPWFSATEPNWEYRNCLGSLFASVVHLRFHSMSISVIGAKPLLLYISSFDTILPCYFHYLF